LVLSKRDAGGRWAMKHGLNGKMWADIEAKGKPSNVGDAQSTARLEAAGIGS